MASNYNRKSASSGAYKPHSRAAAAPRAASRDTSRSSGRITRTAQSSRRVGSSGSSGSSGFSRARSSVSRTSQRSTSRSGAFTAPTRRDTGRTEFRSVRVGDAGAPRRRTNQGRTSQVRGAATRPQPRSLRPLLAVAIVAAALFVVFLILRASSLFTIENVQVNGVEHLTADEMLVLMDVPEGTTLLQVDVQGIEDRLLKDAWIEKVSVVRAFPGTLQVDVTERSIQAVVEVPSADGASATDWAMASDGMWLMPIPDQDSEAGQRTSQQVYDDAESALRITDVPYSVQPEIGTTCTDPSVINALEVVVGLTTDLADQVKAVAATEAESTTITLDSGIEIVFGSSEEIRDKERVCLLIMEEHAGNLAYVNVTDPKSPTWRAL